MHHSSSLTSFLKGTSVRKRPFNKQLVLFCIVTDEFNAISENSFNFWTFEHVDKFIVFSGHSFFILLIWAEEICSISCLKWWSTSVRFSLTSSSYLISLFKVASLFFLSVMPTLILCTLMALTFIWSGLYFFICTSCFWEFLSLWNVLRFWWSSLNVVRTFHLYIFILFWSHDLHNKWWDWLSDWT